MPQTEEWTIGRLLEWTQHYLGQHGADNPRLDAEILLAQSLGCRRIELYTAFHEVAREPVRTAFRELVRRRAEGTPVAYLVGRREFFSLSFRVTPDVLIPRPETEHLVLAVLDRLKGRPAEAVRIADVGTGSGNIAVALARQLPQARLTAIDVSPAALAVAAGNAQEHGVSGRIRFVEGDLLSGLPEIDRFEAVVSNPPYVSQSEMATLARDVAAYEPALALLAGPTGCELYQRLIPQAAARLEADGCLVLETSPALAPRVVELIDGQRELEYQATVKDLAGLPRVVVARRR